MRNFIRNSMVALGKGALEVPTAAPPPAPPARPNRRQRRQQELGQRRAQAQIDRALEKALTTPKKKDTAVVTKDGDQYTVVQHEPT